jgi:hypothetical protein
MSGIRAHASPRVQGGRSGHPERVVLQLVTAFCFAVSLARAQTQPPAPVPTATAAVANGTIRGHVVAADSGQPLRRAQVRIVAMEPTKGSSGFNRELLSAMTDADGKYELGDLSPGRYTVMAFKTAYVTASWGQTQAGQAGKPLDLRAGDVVDRVDFSLPRGGVITGRIVDEFGEPLSSIQVSAAQARVINGKRDLQQMNSASTDDLGEFRIYGLTPGQYYVKTTWRRMGGFVDPTSPDRTGYADTLFPGTQSVEDAQRFTVRAGQTISDLMMALLPISTVRVEGTVVDTSGKPLGNTQLLITRNEGGVGLVSSGAPVRPDGTFVIPNLTAGEYNLRTQPAPPQKDTATLTLTVDSEDIKGLRLVAMPPAMISGRIVVDPAQAQALPNPLMLTAQGSEPATFYNFRPVRVADDLTFEVEATAGRSHITMMSLPAGWMVRAVRVNSIDVTDEGIEVKQSEHVSGVDVELTNRSATISGTVSATDGSAAKEFTAVVFAADSKKWTPNSRYQRIGRPDQDGRFTISALPPGDYSVVAVDRLDTGGQWTDPEFLQRMSAGASAVTVTDGETRTVTLKLTANPRD